MGARESGELLFNGKPTTVAALKRRLGNRSSRSSAASLTAILVEWTNGSMHVLDVPLSPLLDGQPLTA